MPVGADDKATLEERKQGTIIEKKTVINLIEAFAVAVKHYLRGEEGVYYVDLYHLVKFLPSYALPAGLPSNVDLADATSLQSGHGDASTRPRRASDVRSARSLQVPTSAMPAGFCPVGVKTPCMKCRWVHQDSERR